MGTSSILDDRVLRSRMQSVIWHLLELGVNISPKQDFATKPITTTLRLSLNIDRERREYALTKQNLEILCRGLGIARVIASLIIKQIKIKIGESQGRMKDE